MLGGKLNEQTWVQIQNFGLGGMGWALFFATALQLQKLQRQYIEMVEKQKDEAIARARLMEQRLFDLKAQLITVE